MFYRLSNTLKLIDAFIDWAHNKDPQHTYDYLNPHTCAVALFYKEAVHDDEYCVNSIGRLPEIVAAKDFDHMRYYEPVTFLEMIACTPKRVDGAFFEHTFAALINRAIEVRNIVSEGVPKLMEAA